MTQQNFPIPVRHSLSLITLCLLLSACAEGTGELDLSGFSNSDIDPPEQQAALGVDVQPDGNTDTAETESLSTSNATLAGTDSSPGEILIVAEVDNEFTPSTDITISEETGSDNVTTAPSEQSEDETYEVDIDNPTIVIDPDVADTEHQLDNTHNYANQPVPAYIGKDNTTTNIISDSGAALGRVLFYDVRLSTSDLVSCASCHQQSLGFSDSRITSEGVNGITGRHSMRLINTRFSDEARFFWDERAESLEEQVTQPIRDHGEMGFSGTNGAPDFDSLLAKLSETSYYPTLFTSAFGSSVITEAGMQDALAQFIRSIQSFDSRYDEGRQQVTNDMDPFPNFTTEENNGKRLFMARPVLDAATGERTAGSGLGCNGCHRAPEFDIDPNSRNNGVITVANSVLDTDLSNTRSPSLRDVFASDGSENGPFMHDGSLPDFEAVLDHYNLVDANRTDNPNLDVRLTAGPRGGGARPDNAPGQSLLLSDVERAELTAFMKTLSGQSIYEDTRWSNPFYEDGRLNLSD